MKRIRMLGLALLALFALSAIVAEAASAEAGFLPHKLTGYTLEGKVSTLNTAGNKPIICSTLDPSTGKLENDKHTSVTLHWLKCTVAGLPANSVTDGSEIILAKVLLLVCLNPENAAGKVLGEFGIAAETDETVNLEVPSLGVKITVKGRVIGLVLAKAKELLKTFNVDFTGAKGVQEVAKCKDGTEVKEHTLQAENSTEKKLETASQNVEKGTVTFEEAQELMDS